MVTEQSPVTQAVLLVGGEGTRLRPLTWRRPKALVPLLNQPLLSYELELLAQYGVNQVTLAVGYKADALRQELGDGSRWGLKLRYVEEPQPLGTAGAMRLAAADCQGPFVAMNGDLVFDVDVAAVARAHVESGAALTFCLRRVEDIRRFGLIQCDEQGWVVAFKEKQDYDETGQNTVNTGLYVVDPSVLGWIPEGRPWSNELNLFPTLLAEGWPLKGYLPEHQGYWADVGTLDAYLETSRDLLAGKVPWKGPSVHARARVAADAVLTQPVHLAAGVVVEKGAQVGPNVVVGPDCTIGRGAKLCGCVLWERVTVGDGCSLSNCIVADGITLAPGARHEAGAIVS